MPAWDFSSYQALSPPFLPPSGPRHSVPVASLDVWMIWFLRWRKQRRESIEGRWLLEIGTNTCRKSTRRKWATICNLLGFEKHAGGRWKICGDYSFIDGQKCDSLPQAVAGSNSSGPFCSCWWSFITLTLISTIITPAWLLKLNLLNNKRYCHSLRTDSQDSFAPLPVAPLVRPFGCVISQIPNFLLEGRNLQTALRASGELDPTASALTSSSARWKTAKWRTLSPFSHFTPIRHIHFGAPLALS